MRRHRTDTTSVHGHRIGVKRTVTGRRSRCDTTATLSTNAPGHAEDREDAESSDAATGSRPATSSIHRPHRHPTLATPDAHPSAGIVVTVTSGLTKSSGWHSTAGYPWVSHVFRKTVASRLDDEGSAIRHIADQLGHSRLSMTMDYHLGRQALTAVDIADALNRLLVGSK
jgi:hypothetical protein